MASEDEIWSYLTVKGLRMVLGGGFDINAGNPLPVTAVVPGEVDISDDTTRQLGIVNSMAIVDATFNSVVIAATDIFGGMLPIATGAVTWRIYATFSAGGVLTVRRTIDSIVWISEDLNAGVALTPNAAYMFDIIVQSGEILDLRYSVNGTALVLKVVEIRGV